MNIEEFPEIVEISIEELKKGLESGETYVGAESFSYQFKDGSQGGAVEAGKPLELTDLEKLTNREKYPNIIRENEKERESLLSVIHFSTAIQRSSFFDIFAKDVQVTEAVSPLAKEYRKGILKNAGALNAEMRELIRSINLGEKKLEGMLMERQKSFSDTLKEHGSIITEGYVKHIAENPLLFAYAQHNPEAITHSLDVLTLAVAIEVLGTGDTSRIGILSDAAMLHDCADEYFKKHLTLKKGSETYKDIFAIRDFLIPKKMLVTPDGGYLDGITEETLESIEQHHTEMGGRFVTFKRGNVTGLDNKRVAYVPLSAREVSIHEAEGEKDIREEARKAALLLKKFSYYFQFREEGKIQDIVYVNSTLHQPLYLAELWVTGVNNNRTKLNAAILAKKIEKGRGLITKNEYVDAFLNIVGTNYD